MGACVGGGSLGSQCLLSGFYIMIFHLFPPLQMPKSLALSGRSDGAFSIRWPFTTMQMKKVCCAPDIPNVACICTYTHPFSILLYHPVMIKCRKQDTTEGKQLNFNKSGLEWVQVGGWASQVIRSSAEGSPVEKDCSSITAENGV